MDASKKSVVSSGWFSQGKVYKSFNSGGGGCFCIVLPEVPNATPIRASSFLLDVRLQYCPVDASAHL